MSRRALVGLYLGLVASLTALFCGLSWLIGRIPIRMINLPRRDYWLAPERRARTLAWIASWGCCFGAATLAFTMFVMRSVALANRHSVPRLGDDVSRLVVLFVVFTVAASAVIVVRFLRRSPRD
jgi:hypothetical protein